MCVVHARHAGAIVPLPPEYAKQLPGDVPRDVARGRTSTSTSSYWATVITPADGSCFFHSLAFVLNVDDYARTLTDAFVARHGDDSSAGSKRGATGGHETLVPALDQPPVPASIAAFRCELADTLTAAEVDTLAAQGYESRRTASAMVKGLCRPTTWVDAPVIEHAARQYGVNVVMLNDSAAAWLCTMHGELHTTGVAVPGVAHDADVDLGNGWRVSPDLPLVAIIVWIDASHFQPVVRVHDAARGVISTAWDTRVPEDAAFVRSLLACVRRACPHL